MRFEILLQSYPNPAEFREGLESLKAAQPDPGTIQLCATNFVDKAKDIANQCDQYRARVKELKAKVTHLELARLIANNNGA